MLDQATFGQLQSSHPAIAGLSEKVAEILRDELNPGEAVTSSHAAQISGSAGALVVTEQRVLAIWLTKLLFIFKFPTIQEFRPEQINELKAQGAQVYMHASADPNQREDDYEEGTFNFSSPADASSFIAHLQPRAPRLG